MNTLNATEPSIATRLAAAPPAQHPELIPPRTHDPLPQPQRLERSNTSACRETSHVQPVHVSRITHRFPLPQPSPLQPQPLFSLRKGLGAWDLTFDGRRAVLKHEQGIYYVAYLLTHPPQEPLHALALALKVRAAYGQSINGALAENPIQERNLGLDDAEAARALRKKQLELEALVDDDQQTEPVREEASRELEAIYEFQRKHPWRSRSTAQKCARAVTMAIKRLHERLAKALDTEGNPHPVFRPFARHLRDHLLLPSGRACGHGGLRHRDVLAGCFTYEPPPAVVWTDSTRLLLK